MGAAALIKTLLPTLQTPVLGFKGLIQVCYSMVRSHPSPPPYLRGNPRQKRSLIFY